MNNSSRQAADDHIDRHEIRDLRRQLKRKKRVESISIPPLQSRPLNSEIPLSYVQEEWWVIDQLQNHRSVANTQVQIRLSGQLDLDLLQRSVREVIRRHDALRTIVVLSQDRLVQVVRDNLRSEILTIDFRGLHAEEQQRLAHLRGEEFTEQPFDMVHGPLFRVVLMRLRDDEYLLHFVAHHLICDATSFRIILLELSTLYDAYKSGDTSLLSKQNIQYSDFAYWQRNRLDSEVLDSRIAFWHQHLRGIEPLDLPTDNLRSEKPVFRVGRCEFRLSRELKGRLHRIAREIGVGHFVPLLAGFQLLLSKLADQSDFVLSMITSGRNQVGLDKIVGSFAHYVVLRSHLNEENTIRNLLLGVYKETILAMAHEDVPLSRILPGLYSAPHDYQVSLTQVFFNYIPSAHWPRIESDDLKYEIVREQLASEEGYGFDLSMQLHETHEGIDGQLIYNSNLFEASTVSDMVRSYIEILETISTSPEIQVAAIELPEIFASRIELLRNANKRQSLIVVANFMAREVENSLDFWMKTLGIPIATHVMSTDQIFQQLLDPGSRMSSNKNGFNVVLLNLDHWLKTDESGAREHIVKLSQDLVLALKVATNNTAIPYLICLCPPLFRHTNIDELFRQVSADMANELSRLPKVSVLSYADITEKYPVEEHRDTEGIFGDGMFYSSEFYAAVGTALARRIYALQRIPVKVLVVDCDDTLWSGICAENEMTDLRIGTGRQFLQQFVIDRHTAGVLICLCSKNDERDVFEVFEKHPEMLLGIRHLTSWRINWQPKSENLRSLAEELGLDQSSFVVLDNDPIVCADLWTSCPSATTLLLPSDPQFLARFLTNAWDLDCLRITEEDQLRTTYYEQEKSRQQFKQQTITLSSFISSLNIDARFEVMASQQAERVAQLSQRTNRFNLSLKRRTVGEITALAEQGQSSILVLEVNDRFGDYGLVGAIIYDISDDVLNVDTMFLSCRALERGIEHQMLSQVGKIAMAHGLDYVDLHYKSGERNRPVLEFLESIGSKYGRKFEEGVLFRIPSNVAAETVHSPDEAVKKVEYLSNRTTSNVYQPHQETHSRSLTRVSTELYSVETIMKAINDSRFKPRPKLNTAYTAPRTATQEEVATIWADLLALKTVGIDDDFFQLGGTSLLSLQAISRASSFFNIRIPPNFIIGAKTVREIAAFIDRERITVGVASHQSHVSLVPIQTAGEKIPFFCIHGLDGTVLGYYPLANHLGDENPFYAFQASKKVYGNSSHMAIKDLAAIYVKEMRDIQPRGPYQIGGWSFGCLVAFEMAQQIKAAGEKVAVLALLDGVAPFSESAGRSYYEKISPFLDHLGTDSSFLGSGADFIIPSLLSLPSEKQLEHAPGQVDKADVDLAFLYMAVLGAIPEQDLPAIHSATLEYNDSTIIHEQADLVARVTEHMDRGYLETQLQVVKANISMMLSYRAKPYSGPLSLLLADTPNSMRINLNQSDPTWGWSEFTSENLTPIQVPGNHFTMLTEPNVSMLAEKLRIVINAAATTNEV